MDETKTYKEQVSDFVEAAAHDLHAPLRKLSILIDRVFTKHGDQFSPDAKEYITRINTCVDEMRSLIDGLTELAKTDAHTFAFVDCDLNIIVAETLEMMKEETKQARARIEVNPLPVVKGNPVQYQQLFKNLIENALKFTRKGVAPDICISSESLGKDENIFFSLPLNTDYHKIEVSDKGIGFNQLNAERIFEPFVRLHSKSEYEGSGLGLSICKKIAGNHDGIIFAEGNENEGSRFTLILPENH
ncbi:MAG TPA: ATP-binding protein [Chitinophagaceae bacterium]|jgi:signal transduction histidine kinase|nr:ATP-binding protein [Chitinophagaceae bacterium]